MQGKQEIIKKLTEAYWKELETVQNYIAHSVNLDGIRAEIIKGALSGDIAEELGHARELAKRIKELGGTVPGSKDFVATQSQLQPLADTTDIVSVVKGVLDAEEDAMRTYRELIELANNGDYVTQDLAIRLLADEEAHKTQFLGFLKELQK